MTKIKVYKVIEERMSPSGRIEYLSLPLYKTITEEEINGKVLYRPKETMAETMLHKWGVEITNSRTNSDKYVHAYINYDSALEYMQENFKGYIYTRPAIYECEAESSELPPEEYKMKCLSIRFIKPLAQMVNFKVAEYSEMQKPERKKQYGIQYNENEISGDTDYVE